MYKRSDFYGLQCLFVACFVIATTIIVLPPRDPFAVGVATVIYLVVLVGQIATWRWLNSSRRVGAAIKEFEAQYGHFPRFRS